ncbi:hypothetical protein SLNSH_06200 [Alsobacter soli]|uniref:YncE family protein n=1 Tax=Alsobacter soli TaxID=2109933 RepID=A0A2T1HWG6_9HYPH|nr:YncE family protein [Alsobacter soli]PSC05964.1 hypothetical protein SLNSH_06200 [Alsobacter soli]
MLYAVGAQAAEGLVLEARIPLGPVGGRIDHLAVDLAGKRLFVAELGNDSVGVVDIEQAKVAAGIAGLAEPQGVGYEPSTDTLYVANARDGSVRLFDGKTLAPSGRIDLKQDADNVRIRGDRVVVGYGEGALAVIDPRDRAKKAVIELGGHPEGFQLDASGQRAFVNVPDRGEVAVVDIQSGRRAASWRTGEFRATFPMAYGGDPAGLAIVARKPATLLRYGLDGSLLWRKATCGDADDVFYDARRRRFYVSCGEGFVDVQPDDPNVAPARIATSKGARTSLFVPETDRLYVASPASGGQAELLVFRPAP